MTASAQTPVVHSDVWTVPNPRTNVPKTRDVKRPADINKPRPPKETLSEAPNCEATATHRYASVPLVHEALSFPDRNPYETALLGMLESGEAKEWQELLKKEFWQPLFVSPERAMGLYEEYSTGLFSPGRPGILASEVCVSIRSRRTTRFPVLVGRELTESVTNWLLALGDDGLLTPEALNCHNHVFATCLHAVQHVVFKPVIPGCTKPEFVTDFLTKFSQKYWTIRDLAVREARIREDSVRFKYIGYDCKNSMLKENRKSRRKKRMPAGGIYRLYQRVVKKRPDGRVIRDGARLCALDVADDPSLRRKAAETKTKQSRREAAGKALNPASRRSVALQIVLDCEKTGLRPDKALAVALGVSEGHARKILRRLKTGESIPVPRRPPSREGALLGSNGT